MRGSTGRIIARCVLALYRVAALVLLLALWLKPPRTLMRVGANFSAKMVCSNVFLAGRDPEDVLRTDVQAPDIALLRLMRASVDRDRREVHAGFLGFIGGGLAVARPGMGCTVLPDGHLGIAPRRLHRTGLHPHRRHARTRTSAHICGRGPVARRPYRRHLGQSRFALERRGSRRAGCTRHRRGA